MKFDTQYTTYIKKFLNEKESNPEEEDDKKRKKSSNGIKDEMTGHEVVDTKKIDLITGEVELSLVNAKDKFRIGIKYLDDSKFSGFVTYDNAEDAERTYEGINTIGELLNYINIHSETESTIYPVLKLLKKEIIAIKRDMEEEDIAELALEFPV